MRSSACRVWKSMSRAFASRVISWSRSKALAPVSAWSSPAPSPPSRSTSDNALCRDATSASMRRSSAPRTARCSASSSTVHGSSPGPTATRDGSAPAAAACSAGLRSAMDPPQPAQSRHRRSRKDRSSPGRTQSATPRHTPRRSVSGQTRDGGPRDPLPRGSPGPPSQARISPTSRWREAPAGRGEPEGSASVAEGVALARLVGALVRGIGAAGGQRTVPVPHRRASGQARGRRRRAVGDDGGLGLQLAELALEVGLEAAAVLALEGTQLVDLALEERPLLLQGAERLALLLLRLADETRGVLARLADDAVALLLT